MTENKHTTINQIASSEFVLLIPLDFSRHNRTYSYATNEYALGEQVSQLIETRKEQDLEAEAAAAYAALLYRLSNEKQLLIGVQGPQDKDRSWLVHIEETNTFASLKTSLLQAVNDGPASEQSHYDTRFSHRHTVQPTSEMINFQLLELSGKWQLNIQYDQSLLEKATVDRYAAYYRTLFVTALTDPAAHVAAIDVLTEEDRLVYEKMNATAGAYDRKQTIHGMIELAAAQYGERTAVSSVHGELTYRELNEQANQMANLLISKGVSKGDFVTIYMERSLELIVSLLGILKAGAAYVPLDPEHPEERNRYILQDTRSVFVLTKAKYEEQAQHQSEGLEQLKEIIVVEHIAYDNEEASNPNVDVAPDDLAYIIYTSGSTGRPKGALIAHEGVVNLGETVRLDCEIGHEDVLTQFATYSFDASVWDTIGALFYGAHLYLLSPEERVSVEEFASAIERTKTTIITILPTVFFNQLSAYLSDEGYKKLAGVKLITVAGEALYGEQVRAFQRKFQDNIAIVNVYGPTECTVCTTTHKISGYISDDLTNVPIGKPIQNYKVYIVNELNQLCPVHVHGEVLIETIGLAKGYLNQPEKTADAFVANPFGDGQIYKSGDIAKLLPDGTIEYVGRRDSQIKIRGHRIEIGEIEDSFSKIANVQNVAVICKKDAQEQNMLVGFFTSKDGKPLTTVTIKQELGDKLPTYFVPKWIVQLDEMPISPTGKIDRKKLHSYSYQEEQISVDYVAPQNGIQRMIAGAWAEALSLVHIGIHDDFFTIGGDSLGIIHILASLKPYYPELKINDLFQYRTIESIAVRIEQLAAEAPEHKETARHVGPALPLEELPAMRYKPQLPISFKQQPKAVLLTGATGYLGGYLLYELLMQSDATIYCLVRPGTEPGEARLRSHIAYYFGDAAIPLMEGRVVAVEGNLETPRLGLEEQQYQQLISSLDAIMHSAADVRHFGEEGQFARTNVNGTAYLLELAAACRQTVRFHHISTLGIPEDLALSGQWEAVVAAGELAPELRVESLYTNSKMEAEKLLYAAAEQGVPVSIYRAGNLSCHSVSGSFQRNIDSNAFYRMLKSMLLLGQAPEVTWDIDITPIDYAGQSIVQLALQPDTAGGVYHICNPEPLPYEKLMDMLRSSGYSIETSSPTSYTKWLLDKAIPKNQEGVQLAIAQLEGDGAKDSAYRYSCELTSAALQQSSITCAAPNEQLIGNMLAYAISIGYFPQASERRPVR
ncbi:amino acid adenylation domain-containing protein/thioester reductase domain-containing protein [Paenibacillus algorifonticola]|uniref:Amino acid adenylation domain-containing protein/thioester reductase domain-containing protein n=1 Tax=Paenibacillus algorifonticola TaxID=684063 RepID=A0A1I2A6B9_9BACL|nr:non-ribosomal peptide synthetase [Paenibacillus algorifonticola]SFE39279.1 amino acid adenylation domain-containing protein/thioester reductase domain-containing protein [Paenibacillus algorifonticola]